MNSRDTSRHRFLVSFIITGIFAGAAILVHQLYDPASIALNDPARPQRPESLKTHPGLEPSPIAEVREPQQNIDTVYIYNQPNPLIVKVIPPATPDSTIAADQQKKADPKEFNNNSSTPSLANSKKQQQEKSGQMEAFEEAFNKIVEQQKQAKQPQISDAATPENRSVDHGIMSEGMLLDETQTRMGGSFFSYFYNHWQPPENASNFMITVSEKMIPSMGSSITIKIDEELVFQTRLQPRYDYIEHMGKQAVAICYRSLYQKATNSEYFEIY